MSLPLKHPFSAIVAGPSQSGKSVFTSKLLLHRDTMIVPKPEKVYFCYSEMQPLYDTIKNVEFHKGVLDINTLDTTVRHLIIYDDLMDKCTGTIAEAFTKHCHHRNLSVVFISQNLFNKGPDMRNMNLSSSYLVLFKNPRDANHQINCLSRQMYPAGQVRFMQEAFRDATSVPHGYLFVDLKQDTLELLRLRTGIFPTDKTYIYTPSCSTSSLKHYTSQCTDHE